MTNEEYRNWLVLESARNEKDSKRISEILKYLWTEIFRPDPTLEPRGEATAIEAGTPLPLDYTYNDSGRCPGWRHSMRTVDGRFQYVANGDVCAYSLDAEKRFANPIPGMPFRGGTFVRALTLDRSGAYLYTANQDSNNVSGFAIEPATGVLTPVPGSPFPAGSEPFEVTMDGAGRFLYAANNTGRSVSAWTVNIATGVLTPVPGSPFAAPDRPWALAADPTGKYLYVAAIGLQAYQIDPASGALSAIGPPLSTNNHIAKGVAVDPTGRFVYATWGFADESGVSAYAIGPTGALTAVGSRQPTGDNPLAVAVATSGEFVYTANLLSGSLSGFRANAVSGALTPIPGSPFLVGDSPTGLHASGNLPTDVYASVGARVGGPIRAMGGQPPYAYALVEGELPPGLAHDPVTCMGTGTLTAAGMFAFTIRATDSVGASAARTYRIEARALSSPTTATAVEFYNQSLDHYFITHVADEIAKLDAGVLLKGWTRTGKSIPVHTAAQATTSPVCRYYIPPALGDSHFFGRGTVECDDTGRKNPSFFLEDSAFVHLALPTAGVCPAGTIDVYRVFSNRPDANHRYTTDKAVRDEMVAKGWLVEGDGPDLVVMCAPA
ncbi:MAG: beta-propeller fold lactonase family protein [Betaproteobacteria bacterium]|nr:beta-propeller fold lactonase family protein [Betaproteobacteria bacterium]